MQQSGSRARPVHNKADKQTEQKHFDIIAFRTRPQRFQYGIVIFDNHQIRQADHPNSRSRQIHPQHFVVRIAGFFAHIIHEVVDYKSRQFAEKNYHKTGQNGNKKKIMPCFL